MLKILRQSIRNGIATNAFPASVAEPPDGFRGKPVIRFERCTSCGDCAEVCPSGAIRVEAQTSSGGQVSERIMSIDYGSCVFCGECESACPDAISLTKDFQLASADRKALLVQARYAVDAEGNSRFTGIISETASADRSLEDIGSVLKEKIHQCFGRSLHIREVDAGSCNGCEVEINALNNPIYDIERFGIHFVASPRHADMLLVTGPVTRNLEIALRQTYEATPGPKVVVAVGACAISGGMFGRSYASCGGVDNVVPVDVYVPGCPPRPEALLHGILLAVGRMSVRKDAGPVTL